MLTNKDFCNYLLKIYLEKKIEKIITFLSPAIKAISGISHTRRFIAKYRQLCHESIVDYVLNHKRGRGGVSDVVIVRGAPYYRRFSKDSMISNKRAKSK